MRKKRYTTIIFDLDGVLVDTAEFHHQAWQRLCDEYEIPFSRKINEYLRGVPRMRSFEIILENAGVEMENHIQLVEKKNQYYIELIDTLRPDDLFSGVADYIGRMKEKKISIGLASSSKNARTVLEKLKIVDLFDAVVDGFGYEKPKPDPDIFLKCAQSLKKKPEECIVAEDAQVGIDAARKAGMFAVGICTENQLHDADMNLKSVVEIPLTLFHPCRAPSDPGSP